METKVEKLKESRIRTLTTIPVDTFKKAEERALVVLGQRMSFKGFREGKAPLELVRAKVEADKLLEETIRVLIPDVMSDALKVSGAKPILQPSATVTSREPLVIALTFVERPKVTLKKPDAIGVEKKALPEIAPKDIDQFVKKILLQDRTEKPVDRPAKSGDALRISLNTKDDKGQEVKELTVGHYHVVLGSEELLPELEPHVTGMKKGEKKTATIAFPNDHDIPGLRGKKHAVEITMNDVNEVTLPELTQEYLKNRLNADRTPEDFRSDVKSMLTHQGKAAEMKRREEELFDNVRKATTVSLAPELVDAEVQDMLADMSHRLKAQQSTLEEWLKSTGKEFKTLVEEMKKIAESRITLRLGMQELAEFKKVEPTEAEILAGVTTAQTSGAHAGHHHGEADGKPGGALFEEVRWELKMQKLMGELIGEA